MFKLLDFLLALMIFGGIVTWIVRLAPANDDGWGYELTLDAADRDRE